MDRWTVGFVGRAAATRYDRPWGRDLEFSRPRRLCGEESGRVLGAGMGGVGCTLV